MVDDHDFVRGKTLVIDEGQKMVLALEQFSLSSQSYCPVATSPSNHFHPPVQKWFVANDLIAGDYTASEEIVDVLGLDG